MKITNTHVTNAVADSEDVAAKTTAILVSGEEALITHANVSHGATHVGKQRVFARPTVRCRCSHLLKRETRVEVLLLLLLEDLAESAQTLFAVVVEVIDQSLFLDDLGHILAESHARALILRQPNVALNDVLEEASAGRLVIELCYDHVVENGGDGKEPLSCLAEVRQAIVIEKNLLNDECGNGLTELGTTLHDAQTEGNYLRLQEEADDFRIVNFHKGADDTQRSEP